MGRSTVISDYPDVEARLQTLIKTAHTMNESAVTAELEAGYHALVATSPNQLPKSQPAK